MSEEADSGNEEHHREEVVLKHPILTPEFDSTYAVLDVIFESAVSSKLVIEDVEYADRYFLVRWVLEKGERTEKVKAYYSALEQFTKSSFAPLDMIKLWRTSVYRTVEDDNREELLAFFEWGEPDCIDLARLTKVQAIKFLKNIVDILDTTYKLTKITHSDVCLDNILLVGNQLKLGGWRPFFFSAAEGEPDTWKDQIVRMFGKKRLDTVMLGLLWLQLSQVEVKPVLDDKTMSFENFKHFVDDLIEVSKQFGSEHVLVNKIFNFDCEELEYEDIKIDLDGTLIDEDNRNYVRDVEENQKPAEESRLSESGSLANMIFHTGAKKKKSDTSHSDCETVKFHEIIDDKFTLMDLIDFEINEISFSENKRANRNLKTIEKNISLDRIGTNFIKKTNGILSMAESFRIDSLNHSMKSHGNTLMIDNNLFEEESRLKERVEMENRLSAVMNLSQNGRSEEALEHLKGLEQYFTQNNEPIKLATVMKHTGDVLLQLNKNSEAFGAMEQAQRIYTQAIDEGELEDYDLKGGIAQSMGQYFFKAKIYERALEQFAECFQISKEHLNKTSQELFRLLIDIGDCEFNMNGFKDAIDTYQCAENIILKDPDHFSSKQTFSVYKRLGDVNKKLGDPQQALSQYIKARDEFGEDISASEKATIHGNIALCYMTLGLHELSIAENCKAIEYHSRDQHRRSSLEISRCYFSMGIAYLKQKNNEQALEHLEKSIVTRQQCNEPMNTEMGVIYSQKGLVLLLIKNYADAAKSYEKALECFSNTKKKDIFECYTNMGTCYSKMGNNQLAKTHFERALKYAVNDDNMVHHKTRCYYCLGSILFDEKDYSKSVLNLQQALDCFGKFKESPIIDEFDCLNKIGYTRLIDGKIEEAAACFSRAQDIHSDEIPMDKKFFGLFYLGCAHLANKDFQEASGCFLEGKQCLESLEEVWNPTASGAPKPTYKTKKDWLLVGIYAAEAQIAYGHLEKALATLKSIQPEIDTIGLNSVGPERSILLHDKFTDIQIKSKYWELRYGLARGIKSPDETVLCLGKLLKVKGKSLLEKDGYRLELAEAFEKEGNLEMATKYYQILQNKAEDMETRRLSKFKLKDLDAKSETRSANNNIRDKSECGSDNGKERLSAKTSYSGRKPGSKSPSRNVIVFKPNPKANVENADTSSKSSTKHTPSESLDTESKKSSSDTRTEQKLVFRERASLENEIKQLKKEQQASLLAKKPSSTNAIETKNTSTVVRKVETARKEKQQMDLAKFASNNEPSKHEAVKQHEVPAKATTGPQLKFDMSKSDKKPARVTAEKISAVKPGTASKATHSKPSYTDSPAKVGLTKAQSSSNKKPEDPKPKQRPSTTSEHSNSVSETLQDLSVHSRTSGKKQQSQIYNAKRDSIQPTLNSDRSDRSERQTVAKISVGQATTITVKPSPMNSDRQHTAASSVNSSQYGGRKQPEAPRRQGSSGANSTAVIKDDLSSPTMKMKLRTVDTLKFRVNDVIPGMALKKDIEEEDELIASIDSFLKRIYTLTEEKKYDEVEGFLARFKAIISSSGLEASKIGPQSAFEKYLEARYDCFKGRYEEAEVKLRYSLELFNHFDPAVSKLPLYRVYLELADLYHRQKSLQGVLDTVCQYLKDYHSLDAEGTLACLKYFFRQIEGVNLQGYDRMVVENVGSSQQLILKKLEELGRIPFKTVILPPSIFKDKRLESLLVLASAYLLADELGMAEDALDRFLADLTYIDGDRLLLVKEMFETLVAANKRELANTYLKRVDEKQQDWQPEDKNLYFAIVSAKIGSLAVREKRFSEGLVYFEVGLDYFKRMESIGVFSSADYSLKQRTFFDILFSIAYCCYEEKEFDRSLFFNKKAEECSTGNNECQAECLLLYAKLQFENRNYEDAIEYCRQCHESGDRQMTNRRLVCDMYYVRGRCFQELKRKEKAFEAFKQAKRLVEYIRDPRESLEFKHKIDDAILNFK